MLWKQFALYRLTVFCRWNSRLSSLRGSHSCQKFLCDHHHRLYKRPMLTISNSVRFLHDTASKNPSTSTNHTVTDETELPNKEHLFYVDQLTDDLVPKFLSDRKNFLKFLKLCAKDIVFDDSIFNRHAEGIDRFIRHVSLIKLYFSLMKAASKFEKIGSCIYDNDDAVTVLWRLASIKLYHQDQNVVEGALDIHLNKDGRIYKINNRPITRNDIEGAEALMKVKEEALKAETSEAPVMQMRKVWRYLTHLAGPSSVCLLLSRSYSSRKGNGGPEMFQLEHIRKRLEVTVPEFFRGQPDYTFYRANMEYRDEIFQMTVTGREKFIIYLGTIKLFCQLCYPHIEMEALSILPISEDGTVRLRWRVKHVSWIRTLLNPMLFKYDYRIKRLKWYDGLTIFYVGADGLVYRVITRRTIEDERKSASKNRLADLAEKVGVLPKSSAAFVRRTVE